MPHQIVRKHILAETQSIFKCNRKDECKKSIRSSRYNQISNYHFLNGRTIYSSFLSHRNRKNLERELTAQFSKSLIKQSRMLTTVLQDEVKGRGTGKTPLLGGERNGITTTEKLGSSLQCCTVNDTENQWCLGSAHTT